MAEKLTTKLPNPEGVVAGGTATFRIPVGRRIHNLYLHYNHNASTQNVTHFSEIRLYINGQVFQRFTGTERDKLNQFDQRAAAAGVLTIPFDRHKLISVDGIETTAINTGVADSQGRKISQMYMEIDIAGGATISSSDLSLYAQQSDAVAGGAGTIPYIRREQRTAAGASSDFQLSDLINPGVNSPDKVALNRVTFVPSTGVINNLRVDRNNYSVLDRTDVLNRVIQSDGVRTPQSGYYSIDTTEYGRGFEYVELFGMTDFRYRLDLSAGMTLTVVSEYLGVLSD